MWNQKLINTLGRYVLILCFLIKYIRTYHDIDPKNWKGILRNFKNKVDDIFDGVTVRHEDAFSGKFFKYTLPRNDDKEEYEAYEEGNTELPKWLSFESRKRKLHGVPTDEDIKLGVKIIFRRKHENTVNGLIGDSKFVVINVHNNREPFTCDTYSDYKKGPYEEGVITTGSVIFGSNITKAVGRKRVRLLRKIAQQLTLPITSLYLEVGHRLDNDVALEGGLRMAGPGDRVTNIEPGFTVTWKVACSKHIAGDKNIGFLGELSSREDFSSTFKDPVIGWFVITTEDGSSRYRREIGAARRTPVATPGIGTPTVSPSPSIVVSPTLIQPSKSVVPIASTSVVVLPPVVTTTTKPTTVKVTTEKLTSTVKVITTAPTTAKKPTTQQPTTETTTEKPTTQQPTTEQPTTEQPTTQQPTTKKPTTEQPTTQQPTTEKPTTEKPTTPQITTKLPPVKPDVPLTDKPIPTIEMFENSAYDRLLKNIFIYDPALSIKLMHYPSSGNPQPYKDKSWIEYDAEKLYLLPKEEHVGSHTFALKATDNKTGKFAMASFNVDVKDDRKTYNYVYNMTITLDVTKSARKQVELVKNIATASDQHLETLRAISFGVTSVSSIIVWSLNDKRYLDCKNADVVDYLALIRSDKFSSAFTFEASVFIAGMVEKKSLPCKPIVVIHASDDDDGLWQRILIPVIVIVILLLIIALVLCCVYRRKRKANVQIEEDKHYLNHKKPVIFLEEFEEKPHFVSLQPLILPNEKPPTPGHPYEPRADTPEGPGSSTTVSTESEEKPLTPQSPKDSSRKGYNPPPPYNSL